MAAARLDLPTVFVYGGSILPGHLGDQALDIVSVFEAVGANAAGNSERRRALAHRAQRVPDRGCLRRDVHGEHDGVRGRGSRHVASRVCFGAGGRPSAATISRSSRVRRSSGCWSSRSARQIMTKQAFRNAIAVVMALGGSTNAVLHLLAIAHEARVDLALDDFNEVAARVPHLADMKPHGRFHMVDLDRIGGSPVVMRELLEAGLLDGDCLTVTG